MRERLENYVDLCEQLREDVRAADNQWNDEAATLNNHALIEIPTVKRILAALDPEFDGELLPPAFAPRLGGIEGVDKVRMGLGILRDREEWPARLAPDAPALDAEHLHPVIWQAAATVWDTGEYRLA